MSDTAVNRRCAIPMRSIVFATDFLESSRLALDYAVAFSHHYRADLTIAHVFELSHEAEEAEMISQRPSLSREHALHRLEALASGVRRLGINTKIDLRNGEPCAAILGAAAENNANLLILGTHGVYRGVQHLVVGSNAEKILLSADCPTLTVGTHVMAGVDLNLNFKEILYVSDFSPASVEAAHYAASLGRDLSIRVESLPAKPDNTNSSSEDLRRSIDLFCKHLAADGESLNHEWFKPAYYLERITSGEETLLRARICSDSLIILGVHSLSRWNRHLRSSFAFELVATACCPVLSIRK